MKRRDFLKAGTGIAGVSATGLLGALGSATYAANSDYKALVCVFLMGGNDGNNVLVPTDGAYSTYSAGRFDLALPKNSLITLNGTSGGHTYGVNPAVAPLAALYNQQRLAFIANAGPLVEPMTAAQMIDHSRTAPSYLLSHSDQVAVQQGWGTDDDTSGWAGRALELMPANLKNELSAVTMNEQRTLVMGRNSPVSFMSPYGARYWGSADLSHPEQRWTQTVNRMAQWQFANEYEQEYSRTFGSGVRDSTLITNAQLLASTPTGNFADDDLGVRLRTLASVLPVFKSQGYKRQVFLVAWGSFDTHTSQRGTGSTSQDSQLAHLAAALSAFDQSNIAAGVGGDVATVVMSDFGRTLKPASGGGSDHSWGNNWFAMGGPIAGGKVLGQLPSLALGGVDDFDTAGEGRWVPTTSTDQVASSLMQWMGLPSSSVLNVFPHLANFPQHELAGLMTA